MTHVDSCRVTVNVRDRWLQELPMILFVKWLNLPVRGARTRRPGSRSTYGWREVRRPTVLVLSIMGAAICRSRDSSVTVASLLAFTFELTFTVPKLLIVTVL